MSALIVMYHRLSDELPPDREQWIYTVEPGRFVEQMWILLQTETPVVALRALGETGCPPRPVVITFDDGWDTDATVALPQLKAAGFPATFFLNPALLGRAGWMSWEQVEALLEAGMEIGSHGLDHTLLDDLSDAELERQIKGSKDMLEARLGRPVETLSLPGGTGGPRAVRTALAAGYRRVLGSHPGLVLGNPGARALPRFALRRGNGLARAGRLFAQRPSAVLRETARYHAVHIARGALGQGRYERAKGWVFGRWFAPHPGAGER